MRLTLFALLLMACAQTPAVETPEPGAITLSYGQQVEIAMRFNAMVEAIRERDKAIERLHNATGCI